MRVQSANGMFKKVGSKGEARAVVVTLVTATAHSRLFSTGWALFSVFIETDSSSPPPHGPPRPAPPPSGVSAGADARARRACAKRHRRARSSSCGARPGECSADTHGRDRGAGYGGPGAQVPVAAG